MILYGNEHQVRATNLANAIGEHVADAAPYAAGGACPACADATLTIWGHGGPSSFAEMTANQLNTLLRNWKTKNPQLTAVELVTCDSRHVQADSDSYTDKLMPLLIASSKVLVNVKCLPRGGSTATVSELWAGLALGSNGYFFVAADDDASLAQGVQVIQAALAAVPATTAVGSVFETAFPLAKAANDKAAMKKPLKYVMSSGLFPKLRGLLALVTAYKDNTGKVIAVPKTLA
jgi:hypothetical protein